MMVNWVKRHTGALLKVASVLLIIAGFFVVKSWMASYDPLAGIQQPGAVAAQSEDWTPPYETDFPADDAFAAVAENERLLLRADPLSGHFIVTDKRSGKQFLSYPNPASFANAGVSGSWIANLRSPFMFETVDFASRSIIPTRGSFFLDQGEVTAFEPIDGGYRVTYAIDYLNFSFAAEVRIVDDYLETKIVDSSIREGDAKLVTLMLFPFIGAEQSEGQEGYLFIPDGSGATIPFQENVESREVYSGRVYGYDIAYDLDLLHYSNEEIRFPVFGIKSGDSALTAILSEGEEYANIYAAPAGSFSRYNWVTANQNYRSRYFQRTGDADKSKGFNTYSKERFHEDRTVRYYFLDSEAANYVGMAATYRQYLIDSEGLGKVRKSAQVPLYIDILAADTSSGLIKDQYVAATTTTDAIGIVQELYGMGIEQMKVNFVGWQQGGASRSGGLFPVDSRIGGNQGMSSFADFARSLNIPVTLSASYTGNDTGGDGFVKRRDGLREYSQQLLGDSVSPKFAERVLTNDLKKAADLGVDGIRLNGLFVNYLNTDYNVNFPATRAEVKTMAEQLLGQASGKLNMILAVNPNANVLKYVTDIEMLPSTNSYYAITDQSVPFSQIALHGLVHYTSDYRNMAEQFNEGFLRDVEYGAYPLYGFSWQEAKTLKDTKEFGQIFSPNYQDWKSYTVMEYQRYNQALADVQDQFIVDHLALAPNVMETVYENGVRIIVNYNDEAWSENGMTVPAKDFIVIREGDAK